MVTKFLRPDARGSSVFETVPSERHMCATELIVFKHKTRLADGEKEGIKKQGLDNII
jgi:hypothetical protein